MSGFVRGRSYLPGTPIFHLGPSRFFRGHWLPILQEAAPDIRVTAISLRTPDTRDKLEGQGFRYDVFERNSQGAISETRISNLAEIIFAGDEHRSRALEALADPATEVVTLTVTAEGYEAIKNTSIDPTTGQIIYPSSSEHTEEYTAASMLTAALYKRYQNGEEPFIIMSLDNVQGNSTTLRGLIEGYALDLDKDFLNWVQARLQVVDTMVDRIVPTSSDFDPEEFLKGHNGPWKRSPVCTEPLPLAALVTGTIPDHPLFHLLEAHPHVIYSGDVKKYGEMKIRVLNGAHFALGMIGRLAGYENTHEAMENPVLRNFMEKYVTQMTQSLTGKYTSIDVNAYAREVIERISNPFMEDPLVRLARKSSTKIGPRLVDPLLDLHKAELPHDCLDLAVAAWSQYLRLAASDSSFKIEETGVIEDLLASKDPDYFDYARIIESNDFQPVFQGLKAQTDFAEDFTMARYDLEELLVDIGLAKARPEAFAFDSPLVPPSSGTGQAIGREMVAKPN